ncbi:tyrosine-protein phosphatase [Pseudonocardia broussonetiae]|uniref:Tyrosine-protein phosphatase n=1 Tax=Pseudonocardia broussonetiae TaxID=2736640 RepID=A0A6M6JQG1_9PSEU|nr:tyrosine-protein phosphatase [Pseudonocardia broussonetiae]QJY49237.1 tyrosine-protein phosphatase [Pseudonocardia broussonetiae]
MTNHAPANLRDLRGLRTDDGRIVRRGVLYRSELPLSGTAAAAEVAVWPPADVIDLRVPGEHPAPHHLDLPGTTVHSVPMGADLAPALAAAQPTGHDLAEAYALLARDAAGSIAHIAALVADSPGPVLVHCTAGKDRTGVVVAVLLRAVGVRREDVVADYLRTEANLPRLWATLRAAGIREPRNRALMGVHRAALESVLDEVEGHEGGAAGWLAAHGVDDAALARLSDRLLGTAYESAA